MDGSLFRCGQAFTGTQIVSALSERSEAWDVHVVLHQVDLGAGRLSGSMEAKNVPAANTPVVTMWEGEIIDNVHSHFLTGRWDASRKTDLDHWSKFPAFADVRTRVEVDGGRDLDLSVLPVVFMRWKENRLQPETI